MNDQSKPIAGWTTVPSLADIEASCDAIDEAHKRSIGHLLLPGYAGGVPGTSGLFRTATTLCAKAMITIAQYFPGILFHLNRGWTQKGWRCFQGLLERLKDVPEKEAFRMLREAEVDALVDLAAVYQLPPVRPGDAPVLFAYAAAPNGQAYPHGIATGKSRGPRQWHTEPGETIYLLVTENGPKGSCGLYINPEHGTATENYKLRMQAYRDGKFPNLHDPRLFEGGLTLTESNYVCAALGTLPVTWGGNVFTDPCSLKGNGWVGNHKKFVDPTTPYRVPPDGTLSLDDAQWPDGISPPPFITAWCKEHPEVKFRDLLDREARENPEGFLALFPEFRRTAAAAAAAADDDDSSDDDDDELIVFPTTKAI
jgi:hypothetical protein